MGPGGIREGKGDGEGAQACQKPGPGGQQTARRLAALNGSGWEDTEPGQPQWRGPGTRVQRRGPHSGGTGPAGARPQSAGVGALVPWLPKA